jgi:hypothetical protein
MKVERIQKIRYLSYTFSKSWINRATNNTTHILSKEEVLQHIF